MGSCVMSHNLTKVAGQSLSNSGNIPVSMGNLADTNFTSLSPNHTPLWNGSEWVNSNVPTGTTEHIRIGQGENSGAQYWTNSTPSAQGRHLFFYDTSPINTITGASMGGNQDWYGYVYLPAGKYVIIVNVDVPFSASGYLAYHLNILNNTYAIRSATAKIGDNATAYSGGCASTIHSYLSLSSTTGLEVSVFKASNVSTNRNHYQGVTDVGSSLVIMKV